MLKDEIISVESCDMNLFFSFLLEINYKKPVNLNYMNEALHSILKIFFMIGHEKFNIFKNI